MEVAPDAMVCVDHNGRIVLANQQAEALFGRSREAMLGQPIEVLIPSRFRDRHVGHRDGYIDDPHVRPMGQGLDLFALHEDGTEFPVEVSLSPIQVDDHRIVAASIRDTSDRVRAERKFRSLLESAPDAMVIVDDHGRIVLTNAQAEATFGYGKDAMLGQTIEMLIPERFRSRHVGHRDGFFAAPKARSMGSGLELFALHADGSEFPVEISLSPIDTDEGRLVAAAVRDVTERKQAEASAEAAAQQRRDLERLQEQDAFRTRFINAAAHELYTPLTPIRATLKVLERSDLDAAQKAKAMDILSRNFNRLSGLVGDLLEASRFQSGTVQIDLEELDLAVVVRDAVEDFQEAGHEAGITLHVDVGDQLRVQADANRIHQVLDNLLSNALKFTPRGGTVRATAERRDGKVRVAIQDSGAGLDPGQLDRVFTPFVRMHEDMAPGSGLGLYIAQGFINAHGAHLHASSPGPGQGATFEFELEAT